MEAENTQIHSNPGWAAESLHYAKDDFQPCEAIQPGQTEQSAEGAQMESPLQSGEGTGTTGAEQSSGAQSADVAQSDAERSDVVQSSETPPSDGTIQLPETDPVSLKVQELQKNFSYDGFQMVRREAFAHLRDPAVTIRRDSVTFNTACISGLEDAVYVHLMINTEKKMMAVRACDENAKDALRWCIAKPDKRKSRKITSKIFSTMVYSLMDWTENCRYKILGYKIEHDGEYIYVFDLNETEIFNERPKRKGKGTVEADTAITDPVTEEAAAGEPVDAENPSTDHPPAENPVGEKSEPEVIDTRTPRYPEAWRDTFGLSVEEHKKTLDIGIVDGFSVFKNS